MSLSIAPSVFDLVERVAAATTIKGAWDTYMSAARSAGLDFGMACFLSDDRNIGETIFADSLPEGWLKNYIEAGHQNYSPLMRLYHEAVAPFSWSMLDWNGLLTPKQEAWRDDNLRAGIVSGLAIPDRSDGHLKIISLCGKPCVLAPRDRRALHYAGLEALLRMHDLGLHADIPNCPTFSPRERECLHWIAAGKSDWEIGQILSISDKTVGTHVDRIKHKLRVTTRAQAIVIALRHGVISP